MKRVKRNADKPNTISVGRKATYIESEQGFRVLDNAEVGDAVRFVLANKVRTAHRLCEGVVLSKDSLVLSVITKHGGVAKPGPQTLLPVDDKKEVSRIKSECKRALALAKRVKKKKAEKAKREKRSEVETDA